MYLLNNVNNVTGINFCTEQWFSTWCTRIRVQVSGLLGISEKNISNGENHKKG